MHQTRSAESLDQFGQVIPDAFAGQCPSDDPYLQPPSVMGASLPDLSRRLGRRTFRRMAKALLRAAEVWRIFSDPFGDPRTRRARLTADLTKVARSHDEWSRCLTKGEAEEWARRLATIASNRYGLEAAEAAKIAGAVAGGARKYSHDSRAQARRAREREAKKRERQRPRDEKWMHDHDSRHMTWKAISARDGVSWATIRNAVIRLRNRLKLKLRWTDTSKNPDPSPSRGAPGELRQPARPSTVRGTPNHAPPDTLPSSPRSAPAVTTYRLLERLRSSIERGVRPINAVMAVADPLTRRLQDISQDMKALYEERTAIHGVIDCVDPTERSQFG